MVQSNLSKQNILSMRDAFSQTNDAELKKYAANDSFHSQNSHNSLQPNSKHKDERNAVRVNLKMLSFLRNYFHSWNTTFYHYRLLRLAVIWKHRQYFRHHHRPLPNRWQKSHHGPSTLMSIVRAPMRKIAPAVVIAAATAAPVTVPPMQLMDRVSLNWNRIQHHKLCTIRIK